MPLSQGLHKTRSCCRPCCCGQPQRQPTRTSMPTNLVVVMTVTCLFIFPLATASRSSSSSPWNLPSMIKNKNKYNLYTSPSSRDSIILYHQQLWERIRGGSSSGNDSYSYGYYEQDYQRKNLKRESNPGSSYSYSNDRYGDSYGRGYANDDDYHDDDNDDNEDYHYGSSRRVENDYGGDDYSYYDDRGVSSRRNSGESRFSSSMPSFLKHGNKQIGMILLASGSIVTMLGISLFFNKALMRLGNLLFIMGVPMTIGPTRTAGYFLQPKKTRATICLAFGIFLVFVGWPISGIALEAFGLLNLFGNMFPLLMAVIRQMPIVGNLMKAPSGRGVGSRRGNGGYRDDDYYYGDEDDRGQGDDRYY